MNKLFIVGDSTLCHYDDEPDRFIPRNGYGMWLHKYFKDLNVVNLALSGRSSKSFVSEDYYAKLLKEMGKGDYLLICFGHNDEKTDDRRTDPTMAVDDPASMSYWLYNYYVSKAKAVGATPIMVSSIVRRNLSDDYTGQSGHVIDRGDYPQFLRTFAKFYDLSFVDMTKETSKLYKKVGHQRAKDFHATNDLDPDNVDNTHLNAFGASIVANVFAKAVYGDKDCPINKFVDPDTL